MPPDWRSCSLDDGDGSTAAPAPAALTRGKRARAWMQPDVCDGEGGPRSKARSKVQKIGSMVCGPRSKVQVPVAVGRRSWCKVALGSDSDGAVVPVAVGRRSWCKVSLGFDSDDGDEGAPVAKRSAALY